MHTRNWTTKELELLRDMWGHIPKSLIADRLGRTENAVHCKALACGLARTRFDGPADYITTNRAAMLLRMSKQSVRVWCNRGLPHVMQGRWRMVRLVDIAAWLRADPRRIDVQFSPNTRDRLERLAFSTPSTDGRAA